jgi:CRISPR-associated protein Cmr1
MVFHSTEYRIEALTPIWTGNVDGKVDRIHESGIIGSLRWWYEAVVRGLGGWACDPSQTKCSHEGDMCDVCRIFGTNGWRRRFRLTVDEQTHPAWHHEKSLNIRPPGRSRGWHLNTGVIGSARLTFHGDLQTLQEIQKLLIFLEKWGNIGARPQIGYGAFRIDGIKNTTVKSVSLPMEKPHEELPVSWLHDLRSFVFYKITFVVKNSRWWQKVPGLRELRNPREDQLLLNNLSEQGMVPVTPALKNHLRFEQEWSSNAIPHWLFGTLKHHERIRSKVAFSWAYRQGDSDEWEIRGWMSLPQGRMGARCRNEVWRAFQRAIGEPRNWMTLLGMTADDYRSAKLSFFPVANPWRTHSSQDIETYYNKTTWETSA